MSDGAASQVPQPSRGRSQWEKLLSSRKTILIILFGMTGVLGLPLLWISHVFTVGEKVLWTILNTLYTLMLIGLAAGVCYWCYLRFKEVGIF
jgi:hypothetical protein